MATAQGCLEGLSQGILAPGWLPTGSSDDVLFGKPLRLVMGSSDHFTDSDL